MASSPIMLDMHQYLEFSCRYCQYQVAIPDLHILDDRANKLANALHKEEVPGGDNVLDSGDSPEHKCSDDCKKDERAEGACQFVNKGWVLQNLECADWKDETVAAYRRHVIAELNEFGRDPEDVDDLDSRNPCFKWTTSETAAELEANLTPDEFESVAKASIRGAQDTDLTDTDVKEIFRDNGAPYSADGKLPDGTAITQTMVQRVSLPPANENDIKVMMNRLGLKFVPPREPDTKDDFESRFEAVGEITKASKYARLYAYLCLEQTYLEDITDRAMKRLQAIVCTPRDGDAEPGLFSRLLGVMKALQDRDGYEKSSVFRWKSLSGKDAAHFRQHQELGAKYLGIQPWDDEELDDPFEPKPAGKSARASFGVDLALEESVFQTNETNLEAKLATSVASASADQKQQFELFGLSARASMIRRKKNFKNDLYRPTTPTGLKDPVEQLLRQAAAEQKSAAPSQPWIKDFVESEIEAINDSTFRILANPDKKPVGRVPKSIWAGALLFLDQPVGKKDTIASMKKRIIDLSRPHQDIVFAQLHALANYKNDLPAGRPWSQQKAEVVRDFMTVNNIVLS